MVFSSVPRTISKWVSVEQDDYLNYNDLSPTNPKWVSVEQDDYLNYNDLSPTKFSVNI
jgi:hypothetical protein